MKKIIKLMECISVILVMMALLCGCTSISASDNSESYDGYLWNRGDKSKHLKKFDPIMDEIPKDYLEYLNLNPDEYETETLKQWSTSNPGTGAAYHSYVYKKDEGVDSGFYIWVLDDGRVNDTRFVKELELAVQEYFAGKYEKEYPGVRVLSSLGYHYMPSKEWKKSDGIDNFLNSEDDYLLFIYMIYGPNVNMTESDVETIKNDLSYLNDIQVLFYRVDNADSVDKSELSKLKEEYRFYEHN